MGVLRDLVVAADVDAERVARARGPAEEFDGIDIKGIDSVKFGILHSILTGRAFKEILPACDPVVTVSEEGPWVFRIPCDLVARLAAITGDEKRAAVTKWAATEEFALDGRPPSEVAHAFDEIAALARRAVDGGQSLFLWMSL
jgi:hypothetical protein